MTDKTIKEYRALADVNARYSLIALTAKTS